MQSSWMDFSALKSKADFAPVLAHYRVELKGEGDQRKARCIFHPDNGSSLKINLTRKLFNCFGCGASGNILDFVAKAERGIPLRDAAQKLMEICRIEPAVASNAATPSGAKATAEKDKRTASQVQPEPVKSEPARSGPDRPDGPNKPLTFSLKLDAEHDAVKMFRVSPETIRRLGIGYCARGLMKGRVCVPLHDDVSRLVGYAGFWPEEPEPEGVEPLKLPDREHFDSEAYLWNAAPVLGEMPPPRLAVTQRLEWAVALFDRGVPVVATLWPGLSESQVEVLDLMRPSLIVLVGDDDPAWEAAIADFLPALATGRAVTILDVEDGNSVPEETFAWLRGK